MYTSATAKFEKFRVNLAEIQNPFGFLSLSPIILVSKKRCVFVCLHAFIKWSVKRSQMRCEEGKSDIVLVRCSIISTGQVGPTQSFSKHSLAWSKSNYLLFFVSRTGQVEEIKIFPFLDLDLAFTIPSHHFHLDVVDIQLADRPERFDVNESWFAFMCDEGRAREREREGQRFQEFLQHLVKVAESWPTSI